MEGSRASKHRPMVVLVFCLALLLRAVASSELPAPHQESHLQHSRDSVVDQKTNWWSNSLLRKVSNDQPLTLESFGSTLLHHAWSLFFSQTFAHHRGCNQEDRLQNHPPVGIKWTVLKHRDQSDPTVPHEKCIAQLVMRSQVSMALSCEEGERRYVESRFNLRGSSLCSKKNPEIDQYARSTPTAHLSPPTVPRAENIVQVVELNEESTQTDLDRPAPRSHYPPPSDPGASLIDRPAPGSNHPSPTNPGTSLIDPPSPSDPTDPPPNPGLTDLDYPAPRRHSPPPPNSGTLVDRPSPADPTGPPLIPGYL